MGNQNFFKGIPFSQKSRMASLPNAELLLEFLWDTGII